MGKLAATGLLIGGLFAVGGVMAWSVVGPAGSGGGDAVREATATLPSPTCPPTGTPSHLWVEPVDSPTYDLSQVVTVTMDGCDQVTIAAESGHFTGTCVGGWALVNVRLLPNIEHHLHVTGCVPLWWWGVCYYGGYCLSTTSDREGNPLTIRQVCGLCYSYYLPLVAK